MFYWQEIGTSRRGSLKTRDRVEAENLIMAMNEAHRQPVLNLAMGRAYLAAHDPEMITRTWERVFAEMSTHGIPATQDRCARALRSRSCERSPRLSRRCSPGRSRRFRRAALDPLVGEHVTAEVAFAGKAAGSVQIRLEKSSARLFGAAMLGLTPDDLADDGELRDVLGELANIIVGNFKSSLCDAGLTCKLSPPKIVTTTDFKLRTQEGGLAERIGFQSDDEDFFVDVCVNPWSKE